MGSGRPRPHVWWLGVLDQAQGWELAVGSGPGPEGGARVAGVLRERAGAVPTQSMGVTIPAVPLLRDPACHPPLPVPDSHPGLWWRLFTDEETEAQAG